MRFVSSRGSSSSVSFGEALFANLAPDGGLWCPEGLEPLDPCVLARLHGCDRLEVARGVAAHLFGDEVEREDLDRIVEEALDFPVPLVPIGERVWALELFHGPTLAFKDVGARFMARLMDHAVRISGGPRGEGDITVLVATSGDTGSAVAHAFLGLERFRVVVLFPEGRISEPQRRLFTTLGGNVRSLAVAGSFDDCQRLVKTAFADRELSSRLRLASANSINVGRLLPQVIYYFLAASQLPAGVEAPLYATPSGNFGNLTAGLYAKRLGLLVERFIAATNVNDVVPEYLETGVYRPRPSQPTLSNAMDVGDPSNFERIRALYGGDLEALRNDLAGARFDDREVLAAIRRVHSEHGYILDPHTAVGWLALEAVGGADRRPGIVLATAHPAKFPAAVEDALGIEIPPPPALEAPTELPETTTRIAADYDALRRCLDGDREPAPTSG